MWYSLMRVYNEIDNVVLIVLFISTTDLVGYGADSVIARLSISSRLSAIVRAKLSSGDTTEWTVAASGRYDDRDGSPLGCGGIWTL